MPNTLKNPHREEIDLWWYFLSNHWQFTSYDGCCGCYRCRETREEFAAWLSEIEVAQP